MRLCILRKCIVFIYFIFLLSFSDAGACFHHILFEVASALGTVGLSTGITGDLTILSKILVILLMFIGRVGVLTFGFALLARDKEENEKEETTAEEEDLAV